MFLIKVIDSTPDMVFLRLQQKIKLQYISSKSNHLKLNLINNNIKEYVKKNIIQDGITENSCDIYRNNINFISNQMRNADTYYNNSHLFLIIATDGLYDVISNKEAAEIVIYIYI
jgi:serine/threonine protein phosphatase PrpC